MPMKKSSSPAGASTQRKAEGAGAVVDEAVPQVRRRDHEGARHHAPHHAVDPRQRPPLDDPEELGLRSEEHTSELQSRQYLVCRLLLEKKTTFPKALYPAPRYTRPA